MINQKRRQMLQVTAALLPVSTLTACEFLPHHDRLTESRPMTPTTQQGNFSGIHDFDFLVGYWRIENRRLTQRLQQGTEWESFDAVQNNLPLPGGIGNYDDYIADIWRPGFVGMSLRLFNPQTGLWSIYWLDNLTAGVDEAGTLRPPVVGKFNGQIGIFEGDDELDGKKIRVRYTWTKINPMRATWEQAMSPDQGQTWETNWHMAMYKTDKPV